jgi:hypothetical protein
MCIEAGQSSKMLVQTCSNLFCIFCTVFLDCRDPERGAFSSYVVPRKSGNPDLQHKEKYLHHRFTLNHWQVDQIGRKIAPWVIVYLGQFSVNYRSGTNLQATIFHCTGYVLILTKMYWATFWAFFHKLI